MRLHNVTGRDGLALLREDKVDFAVGSMLEVDDDVRYRPMFRYDTKLIVPEGHPLTLRDQISLEDISKHGLILPPRHLSTWGMVELVFRSHGLDYQVTLEAGGWEVIKRYVEMGLGVSIVTSICLRGDEKLTALALSEVLSRPHLWGRVAARTLSHPPHANSPNCWKPERATT